MLLELAGLIFIMYGAFSGVIDIYKKLVPETMLYIKIGNVLYLVKEKNLIPFYDAEGNKK